MKSNLAGISTRWLFVIASFSIVPSPRDVVDAFTSRIHHCLHWPHRGRSTCKEGFYSNANDNNIDGVGPLTDELSNVIASRHPRIAKHISSNPDSFVRPTEEWFHHYLDLSVSEKKKLYSRWPNGTNRIQRLGRQRLHAWFAFFLSDTVGLNHDQLRKMIVSRPQLLSYKLSNLNSTSIFFREELGLSNEEFASLLQSYPSVLMYSIDSRLRPTVDFLQNECGGGKHNWASWKRVIYSYPNVFSHSLEKTLLPKVKYLCNGSGKLGLNRSEMSQVVARFPPTLWLSEGNLQSKLDFLSDLLDLTGSELRTIIVSYPQMLGLSVESNLKHKMDFFLDASAYSGNFTNTQHSINCGLSKAQLKEFVLYQPALLAYSLENRLKPRISRMQEKNIYFIYCPKNIMSYTDSKFDNWISVQVATWTILE